MLLANCFGFGSMVFHGIWLVMRRLIFSSGSETILQLLMARGPDLADLEEKQLVNVGDTVVDIQAGLNAGVWTVSVARTGNETGLSQR